MALRDLKPLKAESELNGEIHYSSDLRTIHYKKNVIKSIEKEKVPSC